MLVKPLFEKILREPIVLDTSVIKIEVLLLREEHADGVADLYRSGYEAGDFYASNWTNGEIFNPKWVAGQTLREDATWLVLTLDGKIVGSTALFETGGSVLSDETYVSPAMRGKRILPTLFAWMFREMATLPLIIEGEIVLGPHTGSMRKVLQGSHGWVSLGILPNKLVSKTTGGQTSLLVVRRYPRGWKAGGSPKIIPAFSHMYEIAKEQLGLPQAEVVAHYSQPRMRQAEKYTEMEVDARDPGAQAEALDQGFVPIAFFPEKMSFLTARFPIPADFSYLHEEAIASNKKLADYFGRITASGPASRTSLAL